MPSMSGSDQTRRAYSLSSLSIRFIRCDQQHSAADSFSHFVQTPRGAFESTGHLKQKLCLVDV